MSYDFEYYSGQMLRMPKKPTKPILERNPSSVEARAYADALEEYEREMKAYDADLSWYREERNTLLKKFQNELKEDYSLESAEFDVIWSEAWDQGHDEGLYQVYYEFERLYDFVMKYIKVSKKG